MRIPARAASVAALFAISATSLSGQGMVDKFGFVSRNGTVIDAAYAETGEFSDGLAAVAKERGGPWGYIDKAGKMVIPERFKRANPFRNGVAFVRDKDDKSLIIDKRGKTIKELGDMYPSVATMPGSDGPIPFASQRGLGYMTEKGDVVVPPAFEEADFFYEGLAAVRKGGKIGFIDPTGKMVIAPQF